MDIGSNSSYPANALSNFSGHRFEIEGIQCNSMEGFLQSLKFKSPQMQEEVCKLVGRSAKFRGKHKKWYRTQCLFWKGYPIKRDSELYQKLLDKAYQCIYDQSDSFRRALRASGNAKLTHSIGKNSINMTVLTNTEFISRLIKLRDGRRISDMKEINKQNLLF